MFLLQEESDLPLVMVENFLPRVEIENIYKDLVELQPYFQKKQRNSSLWLPDENIPLGYTLNNLNKFFFNQGVIEFLKHCKHKVFQLYSQKTLTGRTFIKSFKNGDYYNWNTIREIEGQSLFGSYLSKTPELTMSLTLINNNNIKGGEQLLMHNGKCYSYPLKNNFLCIYPSSMLEARTEVICNSDVAWENTLFNIQIWACQNERN